MSLDGLLDALAQIGQLFAQGFLQLVAFCHAVSADLKNQCQSKRPGSGSRTRERETRH